MRQRAMIAMSIANDPDVLIADEPTTALDVTIQAQVLEVLERIQDRTQSSIMLITHDLGVVAGVADRVLVMYAGRQVRDRRRRRRSSTSRGTRTPRGLLALAAAARPPADSERLAPHRGPAAVADRPAAGLRVPPALPAAPRSRAVCDRSGPELRAGRPTATGRRATSPSELAAARGRDAGRSPDDDRDVDRRGRDAGDGGAPVLEVRDLVKDFPIRAGLLAPPGRRPCRRSSGVSFDGRAGARRSGWWGSRAAASPRPGGCVLRLLDADVGHRCEFDGDRRPRRAGAGAARSCGGGCRSSSRTRTRR